MLMSKDLRVPKVSDMTSWDALRLQALAETIENAARLNPPAAIAAALHNPVIHGLTVNTAQRRSSQAANRVLFERGLFE